MSSLVPCCIAGCRRSIGIGAALKRWGYVPREYICQPHWARLSKTERRVWHRIRRMERRFGCEVRPAASARIWRRLKSKAAA